MNEEDRRSFLKSITLASAALVLLPNKALALPDYITSVYCNGKKLANIKVFSYSICREMTPIYTLPRARPPRKMRGIAGTMVFEESWEYTNLFEVRIGNEMRWTGKITDVEIITEGYSFSGIVKPNQSYTWLARDFSNDSLRLDNRAPVNHGEWVK